MNARQMKERTEAYFSECDLTRERFTLKSGGVSERQIPYTLYGLAGALRLAPEELLRLAREGQAYERRLLTRALNRVAAHIMERALLGELSHQMATLALNGLGAQSESGEAEDGVLSVVMTGEALACSD